MFGLCQLWSSKFNRSSDDDYHREIQIPRFFLGIIGIWPEHGETRSIRFYVSVTMVTLFAALPRFMGLFTIVNENEFFFQVGVVMYQIYVIFAMLLLHFNSNVGRSILEEMRDNWKTTHSMEDKKVMRHYAEYSRKISLVTVAILSFVSWLNPLIAKAIKGGHSLATVGTVEIPFLPSNPFGDALGNIAFYIARIIAAIPPIGIEPCLTVLIVHTCGQLVILRNRITTYGGKIRHHFGEDISRMCSCLKCLVDSHVKICDFVRRIDGYFHIVLFMRLFVGVIDFVCSGFEASKAITKGEYAHLMTFALFTLLIYSTILISCSMAEMCQQASYALGDAAYSTEWMTKHPRVSQRLTFIIRQSRVPLKFTAGKYFVLSRSLFKECFLTGLSYISTLMTIKLGK
ncbi:uncharacterized protein LOC114841064 isoform X2 [Diachasma alloeum]|uniref:Odorant receptor n=1 Tax=Diachasma alloeum TaxID=454923 RepID=A0A4E0RNE8_9HYME|nr:uncharacterized protein LOC114841064 isoform X2 [Diachasma alloeum]THK32936.1 odorant receptor 39 [Diachasma alloeum]